MSEKTVRQDKKAAGATPKQEARMIREIRVQIMSNNTIRVVGFPNHFRSCLSLVKGITEAVMMSFIDAAETGKFDRANGTIQESPILVPGRKGLVSVYSGKAAK